MKIGIDARFLTHPQPGGFKTYTENLIADLAKVDTENQYILYLDRKPDNQDKIPTQTNFENRVVPGSLPLLGLPWREQVGLTRQIARDRIDLFHSLCLTAPLNLSCPLVITIHDMIWAFPEKYSHSGSKSIKRKLMEWYNHLIPQYAIGHASAIITVSGAAKKDIVQHLGLIPDQVHVTYEAAGPAYHRILDSTRIKSICSKYDLPTSFILAVGSADPRKNIQALIQGYALLSEGLRKNYHLVIVWTHSFLTSELMSQVDILGIRKTVHFLLDISNDDLALLYNAASLFVFPSLYEGFGLPLLEAMACGAPVIAAHTSSIPEIADNAAVLFEAKDAEGLANTIERVLCDREFTSEIVQKGLRRNAMFSWEKCARETLAVYEKVLPAKN